MKALKLSKGLTAFVSEEDFEWASQFKWTASEQSKFGAGVHYAIRWTSRKLHPQGRQFKVWLHIEIGKRMWNGIPAGHVPHHGEGGTLVCTRNNLTCITSEENNRLAREKSWHTRVGAVAL